MGRSYSRPIAGETPTGTGATYISLSRHSSRTNVDVFVNGTVTFTVDSTVMNILYDTATQSAINLQPNPPDMADPTDADIWDEEIASGSADAAAAINTPIAALRINITAGTGSVRYRIQQT